VAKLPLFKFKAFTTESFQTTSVAWTAEALAGKAFPSDVEQLISWAADHLEPIVGKSVVYGIFPDNSKVADAICVLVITRHSPRSKWVKMLKVNLRPKIDEALNSVDDSSNFAMREALAIFMNATIGVLQFGESENASTIKVYGRTRQQLDFLRFLGIELEKVKTNPMRSTMEGRFLVVKSI